MIRLLTDGGYPSLFNYVGELFPIDKRGHLYYIRIKGEEYVFYPDEVEIVNVYEEPKPWGLVITILVALAAIALVIFN